ncbi:hypothetical protein BH10ACI2_BH10ACI2_00030 [soil metagenome]
MAKGLRPRGQSCDVAILLVLQLLIISSVRVCRASVWGIEVEAESLSTRPSTGCASMFQKERRSPNRASMLTLF